MRVLVIHHDQEIVANCRPLLEKQGFRVESLTPKVEVIRNLYHDLPDAIICGIQMPELNGYQLCRLLKSDPLTRSIPVLLISDAQEKMDNFWSIKAGADDFLKTDELRTKLLKKLGAVLDIYSHVSPVRPGEKNGKPDAQSIHARLNHLLDVALTENTLMSEFRDLSDLARDPALLSYMLFSLLESILDYDAAAIFYNDTGKGPHSVTLHLPENKTQSPQALEKAGKTFIKHLQEKTINPVALDDARIETVGTPDETARESRYETTYTCDFTHDGEFIGSLRLFSKQKADYENIFPIRLIESEVKWLMRIRHLYSQAEYYAIMDATTGLLNHKHFMRTLQNEFRSAKRYELDLSLALIEITDFKHINKTFGYAAGDLVLKELARVAMGTFRGSDMIARHGSREISVLFAQTPPREAQKALERMVHELEELDIVFNGDKIPVHVNVGLTSMNESTESVEALMEQIKVATENSRQQGENHIEIYASR